MYLCLKSPSGSSRRIENLLDLDQMSGEKSYIRTCQIPNEFYQERRENAINEPSLIQKSSTTVSSSSEHSKKIDSSVDNCITNVIPSEGYHKTLELGGCRELAEVVIDDVNSSGSHCERENPEEDDEENNEMLGGIFAFSEQGTIFSCGLYRCD